MSECKFAILRLLLTKQFKQKILKQENENIRFNQFFNEKK